MMTKFCIAVILAMCGIPLLAEADYQSGLTNALHLFSSSRYWERMQSTNYINALISSTTNADRIAECRLLKAAVLVECVESELDDAAYSEATNLCATVKAEYSGRSDNWRLWGSILVDMQALSAMEQYTNVYVVATNAIALSPPLDFARSTNVWTALFGAEIPDVISLRDAFRFNAADALLSIDKTADVDALTNGLPQEMVIRFGGIHGD